MDESHPEFTIEYGIADKKKAKNLLLGKAVDDAKDKAEILANAANVILKEIVSIDYTIDNDDFISTFSHGSMPWNVWKLLGISKWTCRQKILPSMI